MVSALVIKVKYGDSIRRFDCYLDKNGLLGIDLDGLKARIRSLFNLNPDNNPILTYIDEDNDNVALFDEVDFYYAVQQCLNPMRITACLDYCERIRSGGVIGRSSRYSLPSVYTDFEEFLKDVPKPLQGRASELFDNVMNGDISSIPEFSQIMECRAKVKSRCQTSGASEIDLKAPGCLETSKVPFSTPKVSLGEECFAPIHKSCQKELNKGNINYNVFTIPLDPGSINGNSLPDGAIKGVSKHDPIQQSLDQFQQFRTNTSSVDVLRYSGIRPRVTGLASLLIQENNIKDGNKMKPYTKMWRMCNNGTIAWPKGTQLLWIGGDKLTDKVSFQIQTSCGEVRMNDEVDIVIDFTTPKQPGRYSSYWRLALCTGYKFGQVVCVDIQVRSSSIDNSKWNSGVRVLPDKTKKVLPNLVHVGTLPDVKRSTGSEEDDEDKRFKKFSGKRKGMKRDGFNLNKLCGVSASDLGLPKYDSYDIEWIAHNYQTRRNQVKAQRRAKGLVSAF